MSENSQQRPKPVIFGCSGAKLGLGERATFRAANPLGFILFKRNCETPDQIRGLILELKQAAGRDDIVVAVDQEGGRVSRLGPPQWPEYPPARAFGMMYESDPEWGVEAIRLYTRLMAHELTSLGIDVNCAPVVDLYNPNGSPAIGDRAFSESPSIVAALARVQIETYLANGVLPVIKHMPGHGKLRADPHETLPAIDAPRSELEEQDFIPFELLKDAPLGMNSHAVFKSLDPENPASLSIKVNGEIIRDRLGFDGLLLSDDLAMKAIKGLPGEMAIRALKAGNDVVLHCNADGSQMEAIARALEPMGAASWERWEHAKAMLGTPDPLYDPTEDAQRLDILLGGLAYEKRT